ncbi:glycosyltransferase family protein [Paracoccus shandongensis]|uniref:glycosyltransferase family protein n=1 Tax=Paracoccus shandongensis TaxID=2816048 RepID=UPI001A8F1CF8|nr:glycosyltransferase [Paracoccus shandongensis]
MTSETRIHCRSLLDRFTASRRPRVLFFPSSPPEAASLLRAYNMATALTDLGWRADCVSPLVRRGGRMRLIRAFRPNLLVFQQCRHPLNAAEHARGIPYVLDTDDADFYLEVPGLKDRLERTSRQAAGVIAGSRFLRDWHAARCARTTVIWTGTPMSDGPRPDHRERGEPPVLAWAQAKPLDYKQELDFVLDLAGRLQDCGIVFTLRFYGVASEGEAAELRRRLPAGIPIQTMPPLPYEEFLRSLREVSVGLSPIMAVSPFSRGKSFGKILAYLDAKVPVITSREADHALFFTPDSGIVSNDMDVWVEGAGRLLRDPAARQAMADAAFDDFRNRLSLASAAALTDAFLRNVIAGTPGGRVSGLGGRALSG